jgi:ribose 1,5-bisphosphokinase PhnN
MAATLKAVRVELDVSNVSNMDQARAYIEEIAHQYADLTVTNINVSSNKITFDVGSPGMEDLSPSDIKFRIEEFINMNMAPFNIARLNVGGLTTVTLEAAKTTTPAATVKMKTVRVELDVSNVSNMDQARAYIEEIAHQYADLTVTNINVSSNKITFDVGSPGMEDLSPSDIKFRIEEFINMNMAPFNIHSVRAG